jgi:hypothetical protein
MSLCVSCGRKPRFSALSRCKDCFVQGVEHDRQARAAKRASARKAKATQHAEWKLPKRERTRCGARTRAGHPCKRLPIEGKRRCRNHGGLSVGPVTSEGIERVTCNLRLTPSWKKRESAPVGAPPRAHAR